MVILYSDNKSKLYVSDNILRFDILDLIDDNSFNNLTYNLDKFYNKCKKNNTQFYLIIDFTKTLNSDIRTTIYYGKLFVNHLNENKSIIQEYLYGTLLISTHLISFVWPLLTKFYTPIKPVKIIGPDEPIDFSFITN